MFSTQASFSQQVLDKLNKKTCCFKKKGCKEQFSFNDKVDNRVQTTACTKKQLSKIKTGDDLSQRALEQAKKRTQERWKRDLICLSG